MANHKSAEKRVKQSEKKRIRNRMVKARMRTIIKDVRKLDAQNPEEAREKLNEAKSVIARAARKGIIHRNNASRKISRLSKHVNSIPA